MAWSGTRALKGGVVVPPASSPPLDVVVTASGKEALVFAVDLSYQDAVPPVRNSWGSPLLVRGEALIMNRA